MALVAVTSSACSGALAGIPPAGTPQIHPRHRPSWSWVGPGWPPAGPGSPPASAAAACPGPGSPPGAAPASHMPPVSTGSYFHVRLFGVKLFLEGQKRQTVK
jgi:hypothetical protein